MLVLGACLSACNPNAAKEPSEAANAPESAAQPNADENAGTAPETDSYVRNDEQRPANRPGSNIYNLVDPKSQMLILTYQHPDGWITGGNAQWLPNNPNMPHHYFAWTASPDGQLKFAFSSNMQMGGQGRIDQDPMLTDPNVFAKQFFIQAAQQDYNLSNPQISEAKFAPDPNEAEKQQKIAADIRQYGLKATNIRTPIYTLTLHGTHEGKPFFVSYAAPMTVIETRPGMNYTHTMEFVQVFSMGGPIGAEDQLNKIMEKSIATIKLNPEFLQFRANVAQMQTQQAIAEINRKYEIMHQRHLQNMADSDARLNNFLQESDRKHAQVMGRSGSGSSGSGSALDKWDEYIKDVDLVKNPNDGSDMYINNQHDHAWINSDNEVMYMDSGSFNPNENALFNQREWRRVR